MALCTFNGANYIEGQLDSILQQTYVPDEIVVFDDNSSDNTLEILQDYKDLYPDLFNIHSNERNIGVNENFGRAISDCTKDLVVISDQDNVWDKNKIELQRDAFEEYGKGLIFHDSQIVDEDLHSSGSKWKHINYTPHIAQTPEEQFKRFLKNSPVSGHSIMFNSKLKEYILPLPDSCMYDLFITMIATIVAGAHPINKKLVKFRIHSDQVSSKPPTSFYETILRGLRSIKNETDWSERSKVWRDIINRVAELPPNTQINKEFATKLLINRQKYDNNRKMIHSSKLKRREKVPPFINNISNSRYSEFGFRSPILYVLMDLIGIFKLG